MDTGIKKNNTIHYPQLDGLRGLAIILVILFHYFPNVSMLSFGWSGVDLFFVLSGFLITSRLLPFLNENNLLRKFYWNRFLRIVPLYFIFLIVFFLCWFFLTSPGVRQSSAFYSDHWWQFFFFFQNWVYFYHPHPELNHLQHFWSLGVEEQFYLLFPSFILLLKKEKAIFIGGIVIIALVLLSRCLFYLNYGAIPDPEKIYFNTFFRLDSFFTGAVLYVYLKNYSNSAKRLFIYRLLSICSIVFLFFGVIVYGNNAGISNPFISSFGYTAIALTYAFLLFLSITKQYNWLEKIMTWKPLQHVGKISYGLYIFHWPVYISGFAIINKLAVKLNVHIPMENTQYIKALLSIVITYLLSVFSFKYFESYFLKWKYNFSQSK